MAIFTLYLFTQGIEYVVLSLEGIDHESPEIPEDTVLFANQDCAFHPRVNGAVVGQRLELVNKDPMLHNTHFRIGKRTFRCGWGAECR